MTPADTTHAQLVIEVQRIHAQGVKDGEFFQGTTEAINDHSECLHILKAFMKTVRTDVDELAKRVGSNDEQLKANLRGLEAIVTQQGNQGNEMANTIKIIEPKSDTAGQLEEKLVTFETKLNEALKQFEEKASRRSGRRPR